MAISQSLDFSSDCSSPSPSADLATRLDADIARLNAEVAKLEDHKSRLKASLLSSAKVQDYIKSLKTGNADNAAATAQDSPVIQLASTQAEEHRAHNDVNRHRLAYGVTAFPMTDPSPEARGQGGLLGVKFDLVGKNGRFEKGVFYIVLRRLRSRCKGSGQDKTFLKVKHSTVPVFIDVDGHASRYLPLPLELEDGAGHYLPNADEPLDGHSMAALQDSLNDTATSSVTNNGQDLHALVNAVRDDLTAWHYRTEYILHLQSTLRKSHHSSDYKHNIKEISQKTTDALQLRIIWLDGTIGLLRLSRDGVVEKAVAVGSGQQRRSEIEGLLVTRQGDQAVHLMHLVQQLERVGAEMRR